PLKRSWKRYRTRLFDYCPPTADSPAPEGKRLPLVGRHTVSYWSEDGAERTQLVGLFIAYLLERRWGTTIDSGWSDWDVEVHCHPWTLIRVCTAQEDHGGGKRLIRIRYRLGLTAFAKATAVLGFGALALLAVFHPIAAAVSATLLGGLLLAAWW